MVKGISVVEECSMNALKYPVEWFQEMACATALANLTEHNNNNNNNNNNNSLLNSLAVTY